MADSPIHDLPTASSVAGTDVVPIDQGVTTRKATMFQVSQFIGPINVENSIHVSPGKPTPIDADELGIVDTADGNRLKKLTWVNLKATLLTYFSALTDTWAISTTGNAATATTTTGNAGSATKLQTARNLDVTPFDGTANVTVVAPAIHAATNKVTPIDADEIGIWDSVSGLLNKVTLANIKTTLKAYFDAIYASLAALAASGGSALIGFIQAGTGAVARTAQSKMREIVSVTDFGAVGDGTTDDTTKMQNFLVNASNKFNLIPGGTYKLTSLIDLSAVPLTDCIIQGVPGETKITGSFGYALIRLGELSNVIFQDIIFETTYTNTVENTDAAVIYTYQTNITNSKFLRLKFTAPTANVSGISFYLNPVITDTFICNGLNVEECDFTDVGRIGCTIMNRNTSLGAGAYALMQNVSFNRNNGNNTGCVNTNSPTPAGFLVSLDGAGQSFSVDGNYVKDAAGIGIENTGWINGSISDNEFDLSAKFCQPLGFGGNILGDTITKNTISRNCTIVPALGNSYLNKVDSSVVFDNYLENSGSTQDAAIYFRDCNYLTTRDNKFIHSGTLGAKHGARYESSVSTCKGNRSYNDHYQSNTNGLAALRYSGADCIANIAYWPKLIRATGNYVDQVSGAVNNIVEHATDDLSTINSIDYFTQNFTSDADMTLAIQYYSAQTVRVTNAALTTGRNVIVPSIIRTFQVINATAQTLTFIAATGTGIAVATTKIAILQFNGTNVIRITADA